MKINIEDFIVQETTLALHSWVPEDVRRIVFYIHGLQSHAGWLYEFAPMLADASVAVFVLDRRGSGMSAGLRGDIDCEEKLCLDYMTSLAYIKNNYSSIPITLFGHCLGGSILAALVCRDDFNIDVDNLVFCSADLGRLHRRLSKEERELLKNNHSQELCSIGLDDRDFTDDESYLEFMQRDPLSCREVTQRSRAALLKIENMYINKHIVMRIPCAYISGREDRIIDIKHALEIFNRLCGQNGLIVQFPTDKHYLLFTQQRDALICWLVHFVYSKGYQIR